MAERVEVERKRWTGKAVVWVEDSDAPWRTEPVSVSFNARRKITYPIGIGGELDPVVGGWEWNGQLLGLSEHDLYTLLGLHLDLHLDNGNVAPVVVPDNHGTLSGIRIEAPF